MTTKPRRSADRTSKHPDAVLVSYGNMAYSDEWGYWRGTLTGDVSGKAEFREQPKNFEKDGIEYFFETFIITTDSGVISGVDNGVWGFNTLKFRANGLITQATGSWSYLVGYKLHESGYTSAFPPTEGTIVTLSGAMFLVAP